MKEWFRWHYELWKDAAPDWYFFYLAVCGIVFVIVLTWATV